MARAGSSGAGGASRVGTPVAEGAETFYAAENETFSRLGLSPELEHGLAAAGFKRPSRVQELAAPHLLRGRTAVIAAETGSGKTLAYIAPIAHLMIKQRAAAQKQKEEEEKLAAATDEKDRAEARRRNVRRYHALVLCPNGTLCQQVVAAVAALRGPDGAPLVTAAQVNSSSPPPFDPPDFIVATPAGLQTILDDAHGAYGWLWTEDGMQARVRHVILDEADMLLSPSFRKATEQLLTLFKVGDRQRVEAVLLPELGLPDRTAFTRLPRDIQLAGWRGGVPAMLAAGYTSRRPLDPNAKYGPYWRRQYIFSAATMPSVTYSDVGSAIAKAHPDAVWVSTELLHTSKPSVQHAWREVSDATFAPELLDVITADPGYKSREGKTIVFATDGTSANAASEVLTQGGVPHVVYHRSRTMAEQAAALEELRAKPGAVMVCTDAAARGLDVQGISHVVQADFASNAIDFIHRIGRTARAGGSGRVTSLYRERNRALVDVLRGFIDDGVPLEAAFSRARSFSKKLKRREGVFVPRGMVPEGQEDGREAAGEEAAGRDEEEGREEEEEGAGQRRGGDEAREGSRQPSVGRGSGGPRR